MGRRGETLPNTGGAHCMFMTETPIALLAGDKPRFMLQLHVTEQCNLRCRHCYNESWSRHLSFEAFQDIVSQYKRLLEICQTEGTIYLTGGEPLLWPPLFQALDVLHREGITPRIFTNGTRITREYARKLKQAQVKFVQVSLDGGRDIHTAIRGYRSFDKALTGIRYLIDQHIEVTIMATIMKRNLGDLKELLDIADRLGVARIAFSRFIPMGGGSLLEGEELSAEEVRNMIEYLDQAQEHHDVKIVQRDPLWAIQKESNYSFSGCSAGQFLLDVLVDGTALPCRRLPIPVGNVFEEQLAEIWVSSPILRKLRNRANLECKACQKILLCGGCRGLAYAMTGDIFVRDPQCFYLRNDKDLCESDTETIAISCKC
ncbi:MAG: radical SAM protein [Candidatus Thorarchaeota archaeon]